MVTIFGTKIESSYNSVYKTDGVGPSGFLHQTGVSGSGNLTVSLQYISDGPLLLRQRKRGNVNTIINYRPNSNYVRDAYTDVILLFAVYLRNVRNVAGKE